jgi:uncharacterized membrane protein YfcA
MTGEQVVFIGVVAMAAFLVGLSKGGLGGMMGALITPMMTLVMPLEQAIGLMLPILIFGDLFALAAHWRRWDQSRIWVLLIGALVGVTLGTFVITNVSSTVLRRILGVLVLIIVFYRIIEQRIVGALQYQSRRWHGVLAGSVAGFSSSLAHAGGPPISIYLLMQDLKPKMFVATSVLFFTCINLIKVPYYYFAGLFDFETQLRLIWLAPFVPLGVLAGKRFVERIDRYFFERIVIFFLLISVLFLLMS